MQTKNINLIILIQVFCFRIINVCGRLCNFHCFSVRNLCSCLNANTVEPFFHRNKHPCFVKLCHNILPVVYNLLTKCQVVIIFAFIQHICSHIWCTENKIIHTIHVIICIQAEFKTSADAADHNDIRHWIISFDFFELLNCIFTPPGKPVTVSKLQ